MLALVAQVPEGLGILLDRDNSAVQREREVGILRRQQLLYRVDPGCFPQDFPQWPEPFSQAAGLLRREMALQLCTNVRIHKRWKNEARPDSANLLTRFILAAGLRPLHRCCWNRGSCRPIARLTDDL